MLKTEKYEISAKNILMHELIGLNATVEKSSDENKKELRGKIINETKNTLEFETKNGVKIIPKKEVEMLVEVGDEKIMVNCEQLIARPEDRIKLLWRKRNARM